jgi:hypothetical protein
MLERKVHEGLVASFASWEVFLGLLLELCCMGMVLICQITSFSNILLCIGY